MDHVVKIKKGLDIQLEGIPSPKISNTPDSQLYAIIPDDFVGLTPKVIVKPGEKVLTGSPVIHDKTHPNIVVPSPVSGEIVTIERGERRKVIKITIKPDASQQALEFGRFDLENMDSSEIKDLLLKSGIFAFIKQRPYDIVANPDTAPRDIFVTAFDSAPLAPDYAFILKEEKQHFETGLKALNKLTSGKVYVGISQRQPIDVKNATSVIFDGPHPAGNVGIQINHIAPINKGDTVWTMSALDVLFIGRLFDKGIADFSRIVAVTGSEIDDPHYVRTRIGASIASQITVIPEGNNYDEFLGWASLNPHKYSTSHSYFSWLLGKKKKYTIDARIRGGERAIIMSDEYDRVFPMDIYPEYLIKAILAFDIDKMENLGIYEVAPEDFALCEFVDTSKLELQKIVRDGLDRLMKEMN